jgi:dihydroxyacetone kinase
MDFDAARLIACTAKIRPNMELQIEVGLREGLLFVTANGNFTLEAALRLLKQVCDIATEKEVNKILVNGLGMDGEISTFDRYNLGAQVAEYIKQNQMNLKLAFVGKPPTMDGFAARVAQNRGVVTEVFSSEQNALDWLNAWPS